MPVFWPEVFCFAINVQNNLFSKHQDCFNIYIYSFYFQVLFLLNLPQSTTEKIVTTPIPTHPTPTPSPPPPPPPLKEERKKKWPKGVVLTGASGFIYLVSLSVCLSVCLSHQRTSLSGGTLLTSSLLASFSFTWI